MRKTIAKTSGGRRDAQHIGVRVDFEVSIAQDLGDPSEFVAVYHGIAIAMMDDDSERKIGKVTIYIVERGRILNDGMSLFEVIDSLDADSCDCFANLFDQETEELRPGVQRLLSEDRSLDWDLMLIEHLELEQEYRGQGIGKQIALMAIRKLGANCGVITCVPVPLQFTGRCEGKNLQGKRSAQQRVRRFWEGVGFVRIPRSDYYVWPE